MVGSIEQAVRSRNTDRAGPQGRDETVRLLESDDWDHLYGLLQAAYRKSEDCDSIIATQQAVITN